MRRALTILLVPAALVAQAPASAPAADDAAAAAKRADIRKLLDVMRAGEVAAQGMQKMAEAMKAANKELPAQFWSEFLKEATPEKLTEIAIPAYEKNLSAQEVKAYLAFAGTPDGAAIMRKLPQITSEAMEAGQAWGQQLGMQIAQKLHAEGKM
ncbi:MAG TPA: DUF2059 domain-containing protein [Holophagaceae bacterium]|jgi:hypothetical protein|nr:DUF2059 domain-containing protein [Holophagaceae bacterium]